MRSKTKLIATCTRAFSRALRRLHVIALLSDWLIALFRSVVIGRNNRFGFRFYDTPLNTALNRTFFILLSGVE